MPVVTIEWLRGRSAWQKAVIADKIRDLIAELGGTESGHVWVKFIDFGPDDWPQPAEPQPIDAVGDKPAERSE